MSWKCQQCGKCCAAFPIVPVLAEEVANVGVGNVERNEVGAHQMRFVTRSWSPVGAACCVHLCPDLLCGIYSIRPAACRRWSCEEDILARTLDLELANRAARESNYAPETIARQVDATAAYLAAFRAQTKQATAQTAVSEVAAVAAPPADARPIWEVVAAIGREIPDEEWDRFPPAAFVRKRVLDRLHHEVATHKTRNEILLRRLAHKQEQPPDESWQAELDRALARVVALKHAVKIATVTMASVWPEDFRTVFNDAELHAMIEDTKPATEEADFAVEVAMRAALFPPVVVVGNNNAVGTEADIEKRFPLRTLTQEGGPERGGGAKDWRPTFARVLHNQAFETAAVRLERMVAGSDHEDVEPEDAVRRVLWDLLAQLEVKVEGGAS